MTELKGRVAVVTGASSGIGAATARELGRRGARVVLAARRLDELQKVEEAIIGAGGEAVAIRTDVTDADDVVQLVKATEAAMGHIDILVNNAGANWLKPFVSSSREELVRLVEVNLIGAMLLTRNALPGMLRRRQGSIISVGSVSGRVAMEPVYSATKFGLRGFSLALRRQLDGTGVSVSLVSPGKIRTEMTRDDQGQLPDPAVVANTICGLVHRPRREVVVPGRHQTIVWLEQLLPALSDIAYRWRHWSPVDKETEWKY